MGLIDDFREMASSLGETIDDPLPQRFPVSVQVDYLVPCATIGGYNALFPLNGSLKLDNGRRDRATQVRRLKDLEALKKPAMEAWVREAFLPRTDDLFLAWDIIFRQYPDRRVPVVRLAAHRLTAGGSVEPADWMTWQDGRAYPPAEEIDPLGAEWRGLSFNHSPHGIPPVNHNHLGTAEVEENQTMLTKQNLRDRGIDASEIEAREHTAINFVTWLGEWLDDVSQVASEHSNGAYTVTTVAVAGVVRLKWRFEGAHSETLLGFQEAGGFSSDPFDRSAHGGRAKVVDSDGDGEVTLQLPPGSAGMFSFFLTAPPANPGERPQDSNPLRVSFAVPTAEQAGQLRALQARTKEQLLMIEEQPEREPTREERIEAMADEAAVRLGLRPKEDAVQSELRLEALKRLTSRNAGNRPALRAIEEEAQAILDRQTL